MTDNPVAYPITTGVAGSHFIFDIPVSPWIVGAVALLLLVAVVVFTRRDLALLRRTLLRVTLLALTILGALLILGVLLNPRFVRVWPDPKKPVLALLADSSRSILLTDSYDGAEADWLRDQDVPAPSSAELAAAGAGLPAGAAGGRVAERLDIARALLRQTPGSWLAEAKQKFDIHPLHFSGKTGQFSLDAAEAAAPPAPGSARSGTSPAPEQGARFNVDDDGFSTDIGSALEEVVRGAGGAPPSAVVLISDGAWNSGPDPADAARALGRLNVPVFPIGLGNPEPPLDAAVLSLRGPPDCFRGDMLFLNAEVMSTGATPIRAAIELLEDDRVVNEKQVMTLPGGRPSNVQLSCLPINPGRRTFSARIRPAEDQHFLPRSPAQTVVQVSDQKIRVLLIDAEARWEFRFIRSALERDPGAAATICLLRPGVGPITGPGYLSELPTDKKGFSNYDLVILGDVPRTLLPNAFLKETLRHGPRPRRRSRGRGRAARELPRPRRDARGGPAAGPLKGSSHLSAGEESVKPELTQEGAAHLITRLASDPEENEQIWAKNLPPMAWVADVGPLARDATALLVHPFRTSGVAKQPILATRYAGAGKVLFSGVEETWRWRKSIGNTYHYRFWTQAIRWLVRRHFNEGDPLARLSLSSAQCSVSEKVEVEAYCLGRDGFPLANGDVSVRIQPEGGEPSRLALEPVPGGWGIYRATFVPQREGRYTFNPIVSLYGKEPLNSTAVLQVTRPDLEKSYLAQDRASLQAIAAASGGRYIRFTETDELKSLLAARAGHRMLTVEYAPCRNWGCYVLLAALLAAAWYLRKRAGLA